MYLSALQRSILKKCLKNKRLENLSIDSDAIEKEVLSNKQKDQKMLLSKNNVYNVGHLVIDGLLNWDYVTLSYNNKTGETSHVFSMTQHYDFEDLF